VKGLDFKAVGAAAPDFDSEDEEEALEGSDESDESEEEAVQVQEETPKVAIPAKTAAPQPVVAAEKKESKVEREQRRKAEREAEKEVERAAKAEVRAAKEEKVKVPTSRSPWVSSLSLSL